MKLKLSKHGRKRFHERAFFASDDKIKAYIKKHFSDKSHPYRYVIAPFGILVTVLFRKRLPSLEGVWTTRDGKRLLYNDLPTIHIVDLMKMCEKHARQRHRYLIAGLNQLLQTLRVGTIAEDDVEHRLTSAEQDHWSDYLPAYYYKLSEILWERDVNYDESRWKLEINAITLGCKLSDQVPM